jgi:hypothetical protein
MTDEKTGDKQADEPTPGSHADGSGDNTNPKTGLQRSGPPEDDGQDYIDRSTIDFDPDEGLLSGTAIDGDTDIPGPHERGDDGEAEDPDKPSEAIANNS